MCTIATKDTKVKIAQEDMIVYKVLYKSLKSIFQKFEYKKDLLFKTKIEPAEHFSRNCFFDNEDQDCIEKIYENARFNADLVFYEKGFHSAKTVERVEDFAKEIYDRENYGVRAIYRCIIPKGSKYIEGFTDLIVSNQIIIKEKV